MAGRDFSRSIVEAIFRKELTMARGASIVDDWIAAVRLLRLAGWYCGS